MLYNLQLYRLGSKCLLSTAFIFVLTFKADYIYFAIIINGGITLSIPYLFYIHIISLILYVRSGKLLRILVA